MLSNLSLAQSFKKLVEANRLPVLASNNSDCRSLRKVARSRWKPFTLTPTALVPVALVAGLLMTATELLIRSNARNGGIFLSGQDIPTHVVFLYLFLPTGTAVILSLLWSWIDLDARRLEPYFQLSKPQGQKCKHTLELHYPFDFIAWASFKAFKNR